MNRRWTAFGLVFLCAAGSSCGDGREGRFGERIKGKHVTVSLTLAKAGDLEIPTAHVRNDTGETLSVHPIKMTGWYKSGSREESATVQGNGPSGSPLEAQGTYYFAGMWTSHPGDCLERVRVEVSVAMASGGESFAFVRGEACPQK